MGFFELLTGTRKVPAIPVLDDDTDRLMIDAIEKGDITAIRARSLHHNTELSNGETALTYALKVQKENFDTCGNLCVEFQNKDDGFHAKTESIVSQIQDLLPHDHYMTAAGRLAAEKLLNKLNIPKDRWPSATIGVTFYDTQDAYGPSLQESYQRTVRGAEIVKLLDLPNAIANNSDESPQYLRDECNNAAEKASIAMRRTNNALNNANLFWKALQKDVNAKMLVGYMNDPDLKKRFMWMNSYKPTEDAFLDTFEPGWKDRLLAKQLYSKEADEKDTAEMLRRQQVEYLYEMGFYTWQPSPDAANVMQRIHTMRHEELNRDLSRASEYRQTQRNEKNNTA